jgi:hypothetical protein
VCGLHFNLCDNSWTTLDRAAGFDEAFFQENSLFANIKRDTIYPNPYSTVILACIDFVSFPSRRMNDTVHLAYNPYFSAYFFIRNSVFLSQQIS